MAHTRRNYLIKKFARYYKPHLGLFIADMVCALLLAACNLLYPMITRQFINTYVPEGNLQMIAFTVAVLFFVYMLKAGFNYFIQYYGHIMGVRIQCDIRQDAFDHLQSLPFTYFDHARSGSIMSRLINDTMDIAELAHHGPEDLFISIVTIIGSFILLARINFVLTLIIFAFLPVLVFFSMRMRIKLAKTSMQSRVKIGELNADLENSISGIRVSKAYNSLEYELDKFDRNNQDFAMAKSQQYKAMGVFSAGTGFMLDMLVLIALLSSGIFTLKGYINAGDFAAYLLFVGSFTEPLKKLINFIEQLQDGATGFKRISAIMDQKPEEDTQGARELESVKGNISFKDITFRYDTGHENVFENLNLDITAGETVALVGPSGGGKSTLCHLLPRFYELDKSEITLDDVNINDYTRLSLRKQIGIVQQDTFLFTGSIYDNIAYGNFHATDEEVIAAAKAANIHDYIQTLPEGYNTFVGEHGVMLSGGQKQRISIARVFLKNPPILILDEATSALDNATELAIQGALENLSHGRTTLVVAHRLSTIQNADKIVYISENKIQEQGSHAELLEHGGYYAKLWRAQVS